MNPSKAAEVEGAVKAVYDYCPPTKTYFASTTARESYKRQWGEFLSRLELGPPRFPGMEVLDAGCGSCEKATFYHDWGGKVTGIDISDTVLQVAKEVIGDRNINLRKQSLLEFGGGEQFDLIISDGVLHCTSDTYSALRSLTTHLKPGGHIIFSLINVWGTLWWFPVARFSTRVLGGSNFHKKAEWGRVLFRWTRPKQEGTGQTSSIYRSETSWAYDWFANPRWNLHSPSQVRSWLEPLGLRHVSSVPSLVQPGDPRNLAAKSLERALGEDGRLIDLYWLLNQEPNMMYVHAVRQ